MMKKKRIMAMLLSATMLVAMTAQNVGAKTLKVINVGTLKVKNVGAEKIMPLGSELILETNWKHFDLRVTSRDAEPDPVISIDSLERIYASSTGKATVQIRHKGFKNKLWSAKIIVKKPTGYTISERSGRFFHYERKNEAGVTLKATKGYQVYYTTTSKFKKSQKIGAGKTKRIRFSKPTRLRVFAVKSNKKVTNAYLNRKKISDRNYGEYYYHFTAYCGGAFTVSPNYPATGAAISTQTPTNQPVPQSIPQSTPQSAGNSGTADEDRKDEDSTGARLDVCRYKKIKELPIS